jgi:hypothetical protein
MKIPFEVKDKLYKILEKRQCKNGPYPAGAGLPRADFNETTSDITKYMEEWLRDELIKYEAHQRLDRLIHNKEFEFAEQAVDNYLDPPQKKMITDQQLMALVKIYGTNNESRVYVAQICDEVLDRSGALLGKIRDLYRQIQK